MILALASLIAIAYLPGALVSVSDAISPAIGLHWTLKALIVVVLGGMGNIWGVVLGAVLLSFVPEILRYTVEPVQRMLFGRSLIDPEVIRMLLFGLAMVVMMLFRPAGILPSAVRKRELSTGRDDDVDGT